MSRMKFFNTRNAYTIEEFYSYLSQYTFSAGVPTLSTNLGYTVIAFPIDNLNSIWITPCSYAYENRANRWYIYKADHAPGLGNMFAKDVMDHVTGGITDMVSFFGSSARKSYKLIDQLVNEIQSYGF